MRNVILLTMIVLLVVGCSTADKKADKATAGFDYSYTDYASVLKNYVRDELVDYAALKADRAALDKFIDQLAALSLEEFDGMDSDQQMALWINAYNAITLRSVIDAYPVASIKDIDGVWDGKRWDVAGEKVTLDNIENDILRPEYEDPRIYFAINKASMSCPALYPEPFIARHLDKQLYEAVSRFANNVDRNKINPHDNTITTSEIFSWYGEDFFDGYEGEDFIAKGQPELKPVDRAVINFIFAHADSSIFDFIDLEGDWTLEYWPWDWSLNDAKE